MQRERIQSVLNSLKLLVSRDLFISCTSDFDILCVEYHEQASCRRVY
jgi:hypothetical protein